MCNYLELLLQMVACTKVFYTLLEDVGTMDVTTHVSVKMPVLDNTNVHPSKFLMTNFKLSNWWLK